MKLRPLSSRVLWHASCLAVFAVVGFTNGVSAQCPETSVPTVGALQAGAEFGTSVALAGDVAVIGAPGWSPPGGQPEGAAIVSVWSGSAWVSSLLPRPPSLAPGSRFGQDVAINEDGTLIAVGAPFHDGSVVDGGKVVVYEWDPGLAAWVLSLEVDGVFASGLFGFSVTASGDRVAAGEPGGAFALGTVSVTRRTAPLTWVGDGYLVGVEPFAVFGFDVALDGDLLAVGSPLEDEPLLDSGSVDVFEWQGGPWALREHVVDPGADVSDFFGWSVDVDAEVLIAGGPGVTVGTPGGHARIFRWNGTTYTWMFGHWNDTASSRLGQSVALGTDRAVIGAPGLDGGLGVDAGRATTVQRTPWGTWSLKSAFLTSSTPEPGAQFGFATAASGHRVLVGKPFADPAGKTSAGLVYAYDLASSIDHTDLGQGLAGQGGLVPTLTGTGGMCDTGAEWIQLADALPAAKAWAVLGIDIQPLPFKGGTLVPRPDFIISIWAVGPQGHAGLDLLVPKGLPAFSLWYQFWVQDTGGAKGFAASNGLRADYPAY